MIALHNPGQACNATRQSKFLQAWAGGVALSRVVL